MYHLVLAWSALASAWGYYRRCGPVSHLIKGLDRQWVNPILTEDGYLGIITPVNQCTLRHQSLSRNEVIKVFIYLWCGGFILLHLISYSLIGFLLKERTDPHFRITSNWGSHFRSTYACMLKPLPLRTSLIDEGVIIRLSSSIRESLKAFPHKPVSHYLCSPALINYWRSICPDSKEGGKGRLNSKERVAPVAVN